MISSTDAKHYSLNCLNFEFGVRSQQKCNNIVPTQVDKNAR